MCQYSRELRCLTLMLEQQSLESYTEDLTWSKVEDNSRAIIKTLR